MVELDTVLGTEDLYDLVEIFLVDAENRRLAQPKDE